MRHAQYVRDPYPPLSNSGCTEIFLSPFASPQTADRRPRPSALRSQRRRPPYPRRSRPIPHRCRRVLARFRAHPRRISPPSRGSGPWRRGGKAKNPSARGCDGAVDGNTRRRRGGHRRRPCRQGAPSSRQLHCYLPIHFPARILPAPSRPSAATVPPPTSIGPAPVPGPASVAPPSLSAVFCVVVFDDAFLPSESIATQNGCRVCVLHWTVILRPKTLCLAFCVCVAVSLRHWRPS